MKAHEFDASKLDVEAFAKSEGSEEGVWPIASLERLASSVVPGTADGNMTWQAEGEHRAVRGGQAQVWLHVKANARLMLQCQRCLGPVAADVAAERSFLFVQGENTAAELDADSEDDVLALTRALDLHALIEEELLLALPLVPRHEQCPNPLRSAAEPEPAEDDKPNPFAILASLKRGDLPN